MAGAFKSERIASAYLGAWGIAEALAAEPDIVIAVVASSRMIVHHPRRARGGALPGE